MLQASRFGHVCTARAVISAASRAGHDLTSFTNILDGSGFAALHSAARWGHKEVGRRRVLLSLICLT
jgi:hypothetical protein